ncbi:MAG TPA: protein kinase, partial [Polyangiaceae bacterium LLY-WYZ-15_(1-7)]|nr:protein kinase [Polyangiaceae bacterium LLY-WYZ-15_(1-7)]
MRVCHQCGAASNPDDRFCRSCGAALFSEGSSGNADPLIGRTIGGSYVLQEIVGVGGMGRVYRAEQTTLGRTVAIKVIHPHLLGDEQTVARFYTEARASSRLNHPNSVSVIDFGRTDDGVLYLAMEFLKGQDLAMVMHEEGPLPFKRICDVLVGVLDALGEAHALDIVHRDLKPENVILRRLRTGQDLVKVVDFGLATIVGGGGTSITRPGLVCGTPDYMSPEQGRGEDVDGRGDLYACGVVLFELLTDQLPFEAETPTKVVLRHINDPVPDPRAVAPHRGIPDSLAEICLRALEKDREKRYQSAAEMGADVRRAREALDANRQEAAYVRCPACATKNPDNMRFCGACGTRLAS